MSDFYERRHPQYTEKQKAEMLRDFANKLLSEQKPIPPEFSRLVDDHFWDLIYNDFEEQ